MPWVGCVFKGVGGFAFQFVVDIPTSLQDAQLLANYKIGIG
jgi:hypothetical protein